MSRRRNLCALTSRSVLVGALALAALATPGAQVPTPAHRDITYIMPIFPSPPTAAMMNEFKTSIGEGPYVKLGFSYYVPIEMTDWNVDINNPAAVRAALASTFAGIDALIQRGVDLNVPVNLNLVTATRENYDPVQTASELEDRRSMQWHMDNSHAAGWWSHSRYARKARAVQEAYIREVGRYVARKMAEFPNTLVSAAGDGEVEMSFEKSLLKDPVTYPTEASSLLADYSPFAVAEFRDWLRNAGLYATTADYAGQAYALASRYHGDASPGIDTNGDTHTLNGDFGTSFTTWDLRIGEWELTDDPLADPNKIPGTLPLAPVPPPLTGGFDAPRVRIPGDAFWEVWSLFRQAIITHHNKDFARWITTTPYPEGGGTTTVPLDRWYSYQIATDYLFGGTPAAPNFRFVTSASPLLSADVFPYGGMGITAFNINFGKGSGPETNGPYARTLAGALPVIEALHRRWAILEWDPSTPSSSFPDVYRDEMGLVERYRPGLLVPFLWDHLGQTIGTPFESELRNLVQRIANVPGGCSYAIPSGVSVAQAGQSATFTVSVTAAAPLLESQCPWTATSDAPTWLHVNSPSGGTGAGNGPVNFTADANLTPLGRSGRITVAGYTFTVTQAPPIVIVPASLPARLPAGPDFATDVLKDPWDMSNAADVSPDPRAPIGWTNFAVAGGVAGGTTAPVFGLNLATLPLMNRGEFGKINPGKNGFTNPIDTARYSKIAVRISDSGTGENPRVIWYHGSGEPGLPDGGFGAGIGFRYLPPTGPGNRLVTADLNTTNGGVPWTGAGPMGIARGLEINVNSEHSGQQMFVDWVRLTYADGDPNAAKQTLTWTGNTSPVTIDVIDAGGTVLTVATGVTGNTYDWYYGVLPPGAYTLRLRPAVGAETTQAFTINNPPSVQVTDPSPTSGADYAATVLGNPWDMASAADVRAPINLTNLIFNAGQFTATSTAPGANFMLLDAGNNGAGPIVTAKYRYLTYTMQVDPTAESFDAAQAVTRVAWASGPTFGDHTSWTHPVMAWPGNNTYTIDLTTLGPGDFEGLPDTRAWISDNKTFFRFDPHGYGGKTFTIDDVKIAAIPEARGSYTIHFNAADADDSPSALTVTLFYDTDLDPANGKTSFVTTPASAGSAVWNTTAVPPGTYYIYAEITDEIQTKGSYAAAPVQVLPPCSFALSPLNADATAAGGAATVGVTTAAGCAWTAVSESPDIVAITSGASGNGNGTVSYSVAANPAGTPRAAVLTIAGQTFTITQAAATCTYSLSAPSASAASGGGSGTVNLTTLVGCPWTAVSNASFITVTLGAAGTGSGPVGYTVMPNPGVTQRTGTITIGGRTFTVTQAAAASCTYTLGAASVATGAAASSGSVTVTTGNTCTRASSSSASFLTITSGGSGTGNGTVAYSVAANPGLNYRIGVLTIAGQTFTVSQAGRRAVRGDFTGDGRAERGVYRPGSGVWSVEGQADRQYGLPGDIPVPGDYNNDRVIDAAVYRPATGQWFINIPGTPAIQWGLIGDLPVPADYDGNGTTDTAIYRSSGAAAGVWYVRDQFTFVLGARGDIPVPADYDGDGKADPAVYRPATGTWTIATSMSGFTAILTPQWGLPGDLPVAGDFNGDGRADLAVYRPSSATWFAFLSSGAIAAVTLGAAGDVPLALDLSGDGADEFVLFRPSDGTWSSHNRVTSVTTTQVLGAAGDLPLAQRPRLPSIAPSDFDGDGRGDLTVFREATGVWYTRSSSTAFAAFTQMQWGLPGDIVVAGDYDGDRRADLAVWRPDNGMWYSRLSSTGFTTFRADQWGLAGDVPVAADYDGDGRTDLAVFRPGSAIWYVRLSSSDYTQFTTTQWGLPGDVPLPADYDGDGKADIAVFRPASGMWYIRPSSGAFNGMIQRQWGLPTDRPIAADFDGNGRADLAVFRPDNGLWFVVDPLTGAALTPRQWGLPGDTPIAQDYDGDGIVDLTVYRPAEGMWYVQRSTGGFMQMQWGLPGDHPK